MSKILASLVIALFLINLASASHFSKFNLLLFKSNPLLEKLSNSQNGCFCLQVYEPVCGINGKTYSSSCEANCAGVSIKSSGEC